MVVARRLGFKEDEALTLARALTGSTAQAHGQELGIYTAKGRGVSDTPSKQKGDKKSKESKPVQVFTQQFLAKKIPVVRTKEGIRAVSGGRPIEPEQVRRYLAGKFGAALPDAREAMERLAKSLSPSELNAKAYSLYGKFTPQVPSGAAGWGAQGALDLELIRSLADEDK